MHGSRETDIKVHVIKEIANRAIAMAKLINFSDGTKKPKKRQNPRFFFFFIDHPAPDPDLSSEESLNSE